MPAAGFVLLIGAVPAALAGCSAIAPTETLSGSYLYCRMLSRCDNAGTSVAVELCREQARREYERWAKIHPLE
jgi:hypothetical protein